MKISFMLNKLLKEIILIVEFKYVGKTIVQDGERLFELTDPEGNKYILFKQVCENIPEAVGKP